MPPEYISKYITGHSVATVSYYNKVDENDLDNLKKIQSDEFLKISKGDLIETTNLDNYEISNIKANNVNSSLVNAFNENPIEASKNFGCAKIKINENDDNWENLLNEQSELSFSYESTHICPLNGICPTSIINKGLQYRCTLCPYAIRSVDHLPAICAARRTLIEKIEGCEQELNDDSLLNKNRLILQEKRKKHAEDLAAYSVIRSILHMNLENLKNNENLKYFSFKPDAIKNNIKIGEFTSISKQEEYVLDRIEEVNNYPDLESKEIKAKIAMFSAKILASTGNIRELIKGEIFGEQGTSHTYSLLKTILDVNNYNKIDILKIANTSAENIDSDFIKSLEVKNAK